MNSVEALKKNDNKCRTNMIRETDNHSNQAFVMIIVLVFLLVSMKIQSRGILP